MLSPVSQFSLILEFTQAINDGDDSMLRLLQDPLLQRPSDLVFDFLVVYLGQASDQH
jgi:hypothetical protein